MTLDEILSAYREGGLSSREAVERLRRLKAGRHPLSEGQKGLWMLQSAQPESAVYNVPLCFRFGKAVDVDLLRQAWLHVVAAQPLLASVIEEEEGVPYLRRGEAPALEVLQIPSPRPRGEGPRSGGEGRHSAEDVLERAAKAPFTMQGAPLVRAQLFRCSDDEQYLLIVAHHIVVDGRSADLIAEALLGTYEKLVASGAPHPAFGHPPPASGERSLKGATFADFVEWERAFLASPAAQAHRDYWNRRFSEPSPALKLLTDRRSAAGHGRTHRGDLAHELAGRVRAFCATHGVSPAALFLTAWKILLHRYSGESDITVGMPFLGRPEERFESLVGNFVNTLPLRSEIDGAASAADVLQSVKATLFDALDHAFWPLARIVRDAKVSGTDLFQVVFEYKSAGVLSVDSLDKYRRTLGAEPLESIRQEGEYELILDVLERGGTFALSIAYDAVLFDAATIARMHGHLRRLLDAIVGDPQCRVRELPLTEAEERRALIAATNDPAARFPAERCLHEWFAEQAARTPESIAAICEGELLTYEELDRRGNQLAHYLRALGVGPDTLVGLAVERSLDIVVGIVGILKAGGAYLPLDPAYPPERIAYMVSAARTPVVLTQSQLVDRLPRGAARIVCFDRDAGAIDAQPMSAPDSGATPENLAYVIYTSGSTGKPNGVMITHSNAVRLFTCTEGLYDFGPRDIWTLFHSYAFDFSVWEIWGALLYGGRVVVVPQLVSRTPELFYELLYREGVTVLNQTPSAFNQLARVDGEIGKPLDLRYVIFGGEGLKVEQLRPWLERHGDRRPQLINMYGITETTVHVTFRPVRMEDLDGPVASPIGVPIPDLQCYVLDERMEPLPVGVPGELYVGGAGLARGYLNNAELTLKRFLASPFAEGGRLYRTGDLVRPLAGGALEFLGRVDFQVKIRGHRIELGEIEAALLRFDGVRDAVVLAREEESGQKRLVAYVAGTALDVRALREHVRKALPEYMAPAAFVTLDSMPLNHNGKADRKALAAMPIGTGAPAAPAPTLRRADIPTRLMELWKALLNTEEMGPDDGFFDVGGDSIMAVTLAKRIGEAFGVPFNVTLLFKYPSIRAIARYLEVQTVEEKRPERLSGTDPGAVAIIGISCHFPGAADHRQFWKNLRDGRESIEILSADELRRLGVAESLLANPRFVGARSTIDGKDLFDAKFFGIAPRDAEVMDPQLRQLLQHSWKAVEDAGYVCGDIADASVFMSASNSFYQTPAGAAGEDSTAYVSWILSQGGTIPTVISHRLGLRGRSLFIHSNCSSSLVGLDAAMRSLQSGESRYALVGAATLFPFTSPGYVHQNGMNFSSDGHVRAFDAAADGMIGGEGVAVVVLKRAAEAIADGDHIYALLRGVAINNDGAEKSGYYAPSVQGQARVIDAVLQSTKIDPATIGYVEAHGTGTRIGDPIEVAALTEVYRKYTAERGFCGIGSVKTNVGHLDTAAGLAGCIKVAMALSEGEIPATLHYRKANEEIELDASPFYVVDRLTPWPASDAPRRAGLSSFGIGGTNAHAILEEAPRAEAVAGDERPHVVPLSARTDERLRVYARRLRDFLRESDLRLADVAYTLQVGRETMKCRAAFAARTMEELIAKLDAFVAGGAAVVEEAAPSDGRRISLPTYPFEETSYWAAERRREAVAPAVDDDGGATLIEELAALLKLDPAEITPDGEWSVFGCDSVSLADFANRLNQRFGLDLAPTIFFEHPTPRRLAAHLGAAIAPVKKSAPRIVEARADAAPRADDPIAIIGVAGRFPQAEDLDAFWKNLLDGKDCVTEIPADRWDWRAVWGDPDKETNKTNNKWGAFIDGIAEFDPLFFGISPREAEVMDPQQRLLMMYVWKVIEDAGYAPAALSGSRTAIFAATAGSGYEGQFVEAGLPIESYSFSGVIPSIGPARMSYLLNLHGPSEPVETACSSSLVAIHRGVMAIENDQCEMAIVGGVNTIVSAPLHISVSKAGMLAGDGKCKAFSAKANGFVRGEGVGMLLLKRLSAAERDGDHVYAIVRGTAENHGGRANSLTAPNPQAQRELLVDAYTRAGVDPRTVSYIEAHGTGTALGDPIEINALKGAFAALYAATGSSDVVAAHCGLGSVKSNIGHLELAAGIAGVMKVLLQLRHKTLAKSIHAEEINPYIQLDGTPFSIVREARPWDAAAPRRAGVSSFGIGGVNAHVVLEEYVAPEAAAMDFPPLFVLSAKNDERLREQAAQLREALRDFRDADLAGIAWTLQSGRDAMESRLAIVARTIDELAASLERFLDGKSDGLFVGNVKRNKDAFTADEDMLRTVDAWIEKGKVARIAEVWVSGLAIDWSRLWPGATPRRVSLPTYPFARERYWPVIDGAKKTAAAAVLHPLLHQNTSDLRGTRFTSTFTTPISSAALLEMARAAVEHAGAMPEGAVVRLHDVVWGEPVRVNGHPATVHLRLDPQDDATLDFELVADDDVVHGHGVATVIDRAPEALDVEALRGALIPVHGGEGCAIPGALFERATAARSVEIARSCPPSAWAYIRKNGSETDVDVCDDAGRVALSVRGLATADAQKPAQEPFELMTFAESWQESPLAATQPAPKKILCLLRDEARRAEVRAKIDPATEVVFAAPEGNDFARVLTAADAILYLLPLEERACVEEPDAIVHLIKAIAASGLNIPRLLIAGEIANPADRARFESWMGFERSLGLVLPNTRVGVVFGRVGGVAQWIDVLGGELRTAKVESAFYENGRRHVARVRPLTAAEPFAIRKGMTVLITGGAGGLGMMFATHLAKNRGANVVLVGRSPLSDAKRKAVDALSTVLYVQADVCDRVSMQAAVARGRERFGAIDGVIHAAGVAGELGIVENSLERFREVLAPKVTGTEVLDAVLGDAALDFVCYFSSSSAVLGDFGGCDYAVANRFELAYAGVRGGRTLAIAWPHWKDGGMAAGEEHSESARLYLKSSGQRLLESEEGIDAFERLLAAGAPRAIVMTGQRSRVHRFLGISDAKEPAAAAAAPAAPKGRRVEMRGFTLEQCIAWDLKQHASELVRIPRERLDLDDNLADFGFDSIGLGEFAKRLGAHFGVDVTPSIFFSHPTLGRLTDYLAQQHRDALAAFYREEAAAVAAPAKPAPRVRRRKAAAIRNDNVPEPIAIIGMSGRFPQSRSIGEMWRILEEGRDAVTEIPLERFDWRKHYGDPRQDPSKTPSKWSGIVPGVAEFDALFFEISPMEAETMDPRQRLLLQEAWGALEDAGFGAARLAREKVGMFVGVEQGDYRLLVGNRGGLVSNHDAVLAARLSYFLNLRGPSMAINTTCSSGLVAAHQACLSLRAGECDTAIAAGVNLMLTPYGYLTMGQAGMLSPDGKCYAFDHRANGMVPGEAVVVVVLKRLAQAIADGDAIHAVIRGSGVNYDGKTNGITAPSGASQSELLRDVYERAKISPRAIEYIVTHGTGTQLGDPVEINALYDTFKPYTTDSGFCALTSTKTNFGHTFAASGLVSLAGLVEAMKHEIIPPSLHCEKENAYIQWQASPFFVNKTRRAWPKRETPRLGALSSFGMSGTNAHMVVESWDAADEPATPPPAPVHLLALAAKSDEALQAKLRDLAAALRDRPWDDAALHAMSWTLFTARQHFDYRCAVVAGDRESAIHALESAAGRERLPNVFKGRVARGFAPQQATTRYGEELLQRAQDANVAQRQEALQALADLYCQGYDLPWESLFANPPRRVALPTYPFAREHHWISSSKPSAPANDRRALLEKVFQGAVTAEQARALLGNQGEVSNQ